MGTSRVPRKPPSSSPGWYSAMPVRRSAGPGPDHRRSEPRRDGRERAGPGHRWQVRASLVPTAVHASSTVVPGWWITETTSTTTGRRSALPEPSTGSGCGTSTATLRSPPSPIKTAQPRYSTGSNWRMARSVRVGHSRSLEGLSPSSRTRNTCWFPGQAADRTRSRCVTATACRPRHLEEKCPQVRGDAVTRRGVVFGCADGALLVSCEGRPVQRREDPLHKPVPDVSAARRASTTEPAARPSRRQAGATRSGSSMSPSGAGSS